MDFITGYTCTAYALVLIACVFGAFDRHYDANLLQRVALSLTALWCAWRGDLAYARGWVYPHEPLISTALLAYALGSISKTLKWKRQSWLKN